MINTPQGRALDQIADIQAEETQAQLSVLVDVRNYEGVISSYLYGAYGCVAFSYDDRHRRLSTIQVNELLPRQNFPPLDERHKSDWDSLWQIINAAREDGIDVLILRWQSVRG